MMGSGSCIDAEIPGVDSTFSEMFGLTFPSFILSRFFLFLLAPPPLPPTPSSPFFPSPETVNDCDSSGHKDFLGKSCRRRLVQLTPPSYQSYPWISPDPNRRSCVSGFRGITGDGRRDLSWD